MCARVWDGGIGHCPENPSFVIHEHSSHGSTSLLKGDRLGESNMAHAFLRVCVDKLGR